MSIEILLKEIIDAVRSVGIPISDHTASLITLVFAGLVVITVLLPAFKIVFALVAKAKALLSRLFYSSADKDFVALRNLVAQHLFYEVQRLNREADWNDFHYTALEAEVEVDPALDFFAQYPNRASGWFRSIWPAIKSFAVRPASTTEKDIVRAITRSRSRAFLVIGDPGSGKTVSLRHLFLGMAQKIMHSKNKHAVLPLYLNLKQLNIPSDRISAEAIREWVIGQLQAGQDRTIYNFLENYFDTILARGDFFFIFDSFDEIPAILDAREESEVVSRYAKALDDFLHGPHPCRGLVCSRPYRAPKVFMGQRMTIRLLSPKRVQKALELYLMQKRWLARQLWHGLLGERNDLLHVIRTPFYLALLVRYVEIEEQLPKRHYDLFEQFVTMRATADAARLRTFGLTPAELLARASRLAYAMTDSSAIGLEGDLRQIQKLVPEWTSDQAELLVNALQFSKLGVVSARVTREQQTFSFVHRRFQEYFAARYLRQYPADTPIEDMVADNRWREVLVLLCEVWPTNELTRVFSVARGILESDIEARPDTNEHRRVVETLRFLRDGFRSRLTDVPIDIRRLATQFIARQLEITAMAEPAYRSSIIYESSTRFPIRQLRQTDTLSQKRAVESIILADEDAVPDLLASALNSSSDWIQETALRSCRVLPTPSEQVLGRIRKRLWWKYIRLELLRDFDFYRVLFSSPVSLASPLHYLWILGISIISLAVLYVSVLLGYFISSLLGLHRADTAYMLSMLASLYFFQAIMPVKRWVRGALLVLLLPLLLFGSWGNPGSYGLRLAVICFGFLYICSNAIVAYLAEHYPVGLAGWTLLPFKMIRSAARKIWGLTSIPTRVILGNCAGMGVMFGSIWLLVRLAEFARECKYSPQCLFVSYHPVVATCVVVEMMLFLVAAGAMLIYVGYRVFGNIRDQLLLGNLFRNPNARPTSAVDAVKILRRFTSLSVQVRYARALRLWLPVSLDWRVLTQEANKYGGDLHDELYKLAEIWQDSEIGRVS